MNLSKFLFSAAALSFGLMSGAGAKTSVVPLVPGAGTTQTGSFADTLAAPGSFVDNYIFQSPPPNASVLFTATAGSGVTFTSVLLYTFGTPTLSALVGSFSAGGFSESNASLPSATYELQIIGSAIAGSRYTGTITATSFDTAAPVPEPATWAMLASGLALAGVFTRRRPATNVAAWRARRG